MSGFLEVAYMETRLSMFCLLLRGRRTRGIISSLRLNHGLNLPAAMPTINRAKIIQYLLCCGRPPRQDEANHVEDAMFTTKFRKVD